MLNNVLIAILARFYGLARVALSVAGKLFFVYGAFIVIMALAAGRAGDSFAVYAPWFGYWIAAKIAVAALDAVCRRGFAVAGRH
nr:hypothetical protein [Pseudomonas oleovorans]